MLKKLILALALVTAAEVFAQHDAQKAVSVCAVAYTPEVVGIGYLNKIPFSPPKCLKYDARAFYNVGGTFSYDNANTMELGPMHGQGVLVLKSDLEYHLAAADARFEISLSNLSLQRGEVKTYYIVQGLWRQEHCLGTTSDNNPQKLNSSAVRFRPQHLSNCWLFQIFEQ